MYTTLKFHWDTSRNSKISIYLFDVTTFFIHHFEFTNIHPPPHSTYSLSFSESILQSISQSIMENSFALNFIVIYGNKRRRRRQSRVCRTNKREKPFDTFSFKRNGWKCDIEFRYLFYRTLNLMLVNIPFLLLRQFLLIS